MAVTQRRLKELVSYDPDTGIMLWLHNRRNNLKGKPVGCPNTYGYIKCKLDGRTYFVHRLAWLYVHGELPTQIDHKNGDKQDNRIANLRPATRTENNRNRPRFRTNTTGFKGVCFNKRLRKYQAACRDGTKKIHLGLFDTPEMAAAAYDRAARLLHGEFASTNP